MNTNGEGTSTALVPTRPEDIAIQLLVDQAERNAQDFCNQQLDGARALKAECESLVIVTEEDYIAANEKGRNVARNLRETEANRKRWKEPTLEAGRRIDTYCSTVTSLWEAAKAAIVKVTQAWEKKKRDEAAKIEADARERAAAEQRRLDGLALANAQRAEDAGHVEKAEEVLNNVPQVPIPVVTAEIPKVKGSYGTGRWKARWITSKNGSAKPVTLDEAKRMLCRAVADGLATPNLIDLNEVTANRLAGSMMAEMKIPGLESYKVEGKVFK